MIVWIASYPRSGNTLLRMMLRRVFELSSYSIYDDKIFLGSGAVSYSAVGHQPMGFDWDDFYHAKLKAKELQIIKTHEPPLDDEPAIYVVRNGLAAVDSYHHYRRTFDGKDDTLEDLILGARGPYLSWGAHLDAWNPRRRARTLVLTYEDLVGEQEMCLDQLVDFLGRKRQNAWANNFQSLHQTNPDFFRRGETACDPDSYEPEQRDLFDVIHGDWLNDFSYVKSSSSRHRFCRSIRASISSLDTRPDQFALAAARRDIANLSAAASDRLHELQLKDREIRNLKRVCDEREELIKSLTSQRSARNDC
jgi:Sulfotransferase domain